MKKLTVLLLMITMVIYTNAQTPKSGILKKDFYGAFTGDDWEDFLAGNRASDFEKKSNIKLTDYLNNQIKPFVASELKESSIASAVANSTVVDFPAGADVYTSDAAGNWIGRKVYPGEKGFLHTTTGIHWLSFQCGNLVANTFGKKPIVSTGTYAGIRESGASKSVEGLNININSNGNNNPETELSYREGIKVFAQGANFYADVQTQTVSLLRQNPLGCCGGTTSAQTVSMAQPVPMYTAAPAQQVVVAETKAKIPFGQTWTGNMTATGVGTALGIGLVRVADNIFGRNNTVRYGNNFSTNPTIRGGTVFQDSNQLGFTNNNFSTGGSFSNQFPAGIMPL